MKPKSPCGGYSYTLTCEQIRKHLKLTPEQRLQWLEEANRFLYEAMDEKTRKIRDKFRAGGKKEGNEQTGTAKSGASG